MVQQVSGRQTSVNVAECKERVAILKPQFYLINDEVTIQRLINVWVVGKPYQEPTFRLHLTRVGCSVLGVGNFSTQNIVDVDLEASVDVPTELKEVPCVRLDSAHSHRPPATVLLHLKGQLVNQVEDLCVHSQQY